MRATDFFPLLLLSLAFFYVPRYVNSAGFVRAIGLQKTTENTLEDVLRLLALWFRYGARNEVEQVLVTGFDTISTEVWLDVIPQIIARIHSPHAAIRNRLYELMCKIGKNRFPPVVKQPVQHDALLVISPSHHSLALSSSALNLQKKNKIRILQAKPILKLLCTLSPSPPSHSPLPAVLPLAPSSGVCAYTRLI